VAPAAARLGSEAPARNRGLGIGAKMIGGFGVALTAATVAGIVMFASPPSPTAAAPQAAVVETAPAAIYAPASINAPVLADAAPVSTAAAPPLAPVASMPVAAEEKKECKVLPRRFFVSGTGTVRLRADGYLSRTIALSDSPQEIDLPQRRPMTGEVKQNIVVEGKSDFVLLTTDYDFKQGLNVDGTSDFDIYWVPPENC
jgi:hypothetical protein